MDRSRELKLIAKSYTPDSLKQLVETETSRTVYCNIRSVSRAEWVAGGQLGLKPELVATMFAPDYEGEEIAELEGIRYAVYRTYLGSFESIELYLERQAGTTNYTPPAPPTPPTPEPEPEEEGEDGEGQG